MHADYSMHMEFHSVETHRLRMRHTVRLQDQQRSITDGKYNFTKSEPLMAVSI